MYVSSLSRLGDCEVAKRDATNGESLLVCAVGGNANLVPLDYRAAQSESPMLKLFFDGAVEPYNPGGHGGYGLFVEQDGQPIFSGAAYMGQWPELSNNCAEYAGCIAALRYLIRNNISEAVVYGDANIVINQMAGRWGFRAGAYERFAQEALTLRHQLPQVKYVWIPREQNTTADALSKQAVTMLPRVVGFQLDPSIELLPLPKPKRRRRTRDTTPRLAGTETEEEAWAMFTARYGQN